MSLPDDDLDKWFEATQAKNTAQAKALREQARQGGLRFEVYLPPNLADWLLGLVETGVFRDPCEAVFVICGEHRELAPHADLRREILGRTLQAAAADPRPGTPAEEVFTELRERAERPKPEPAVWIRDRGR